MKKYKRILECISKLEKALLEKKLTESTTFIINFNIYFSDCIEKVFRCFYYKRRYELPAFNSGDTSCSLNSEVVTFLYNTVAKLKTLYDVKDGIGNDLLNLVKKYNDGSLLEEPMEEPKKKSSRGPIAGKGVSKKTTTKTGFTRGPVTDASGNVRKDKAALAAFSRQIQSREMPNNSLREETATLGSENFMARGLDLFIKRNWHGDGDWLRGKSWKVLLPPMSSFMDKDGKLCPDGFACDLAKRFAGVLEHVIKTTLSERKDGDFKIIGFEDFPNYPADLKRNFFDQFDIGIALAIDRFLNLGLNEVKSWTSWTRNHTLDPDNKVINTFEDGIYNICMANEISELQGDF